ncbi:restriction endonuclease subunit S [Nostoc sp.]|uniref:restriction endonuclease subunit S n=1 Tax=Nostoc sp. TaxID=1180 RepID=UPI002FFCEC51
MSEKLTELPEGWCYILLKDLGELKRGKSKHRPRNDPKLYGDFVPFIQTGEVARSGGRISNFSKMYSELGVQQSRIFPKGTICITIAANIADTGILGFDACFPDSIVGLITDDRLADSYFIEYFLRTIREDLAQFAPATAQANINIEILNKVFVPLPPLNEQKRIVAKIEELNDRTQKAKKALDSIPLLCDRFRQSVLAAAFRGDLTADWRELNPDVEPASVLLEKIKKENSDKKRKQVEKHIETLYVLPSNWAWTKLIDVCLSISDGDHQAPPQVDKGIPFLVISNIRNGKLDFSETRYVPQEYYQFIPTVRKPARGDILYSVVGSYGIPVLIDTEEQFCFQRHIALFKPSSLINHKYLLYLLKSNLVFQQATEVATGTAQLTVPLSGLRQIKITIPPLLEQHEIVHRIEAFLRVIDQIETNHLYVEFQLKKLNQSILAKAFRGELVPQDPDDEPASVLLGRIRAEREKLNNSKPKSDRTSKRKSKTVEGQGFIPGLE